MLTHEQRCGSKRALSALCNECGSLISPTACREWKRFYTVQHCRRLQYKISEYHKIMCIKLCCDEISILDANSTQLLILSTQLRNVFLRLRLKRS